MYVPRIVCGPIIWFNRSIVDVKITIASYDKMLKLCTVAAQWGCQPDLQRGLDTCKFLTAGFWWLSAWCKDIQRSQNYHTITAWTKMSFTYSSIFPVRLRSINKIKVWNWLISENLLSAILKLYTLVSFVSAHCCVLSTWVDEVLCLNGNVGQPVVLQISSHWAVAITRPSITWESDLFLGLTLRELQRGLLLANLLPDREPSCFLVVLLVLISCKFAVQSLPRSPLINGS